MKESCEYPNPIYSILIMLMKKKELRKKFVTVNWEITKS